MIVVDKEGDDAYVVMDLDQYESILGHNEEKQPNQQMSQQDVWDLMQHAGDQGETWDTGTLSEEELANLEQQYREFAARHVQDAIQETEQAQVEEPTTAPEPERIEEKPSEITEIPVQEEVAEVPVIVTEPEVEQESAQNPEKTGDFSESEQEDEFGEEQFYLEPIE